MPIINYLSKMHVGSRNLPKQPHTKRSRIRHNLLLLGPAQPVLHIADLASCDQFGPVSHLNPQNLFWNKRGQNMRMLHEYNRPPLPFPLPSYFLCLLPPIYYVTHPFTTFQKCLLQPPQISIIIKTLMLAD